MWSDLPILDRLQDCWDPITETQLAELEAAIGHRFPDDYRQFALQFNGGIWRHPVTCAVEHPRWVTTEPLIRYCFGVVTHPRFRYQDLLRGKLEHFDEGIPSTFVHIMEAMGTSICIDLDVDESGGIYLFDASECDSDIDPLHWIADSFSEFLGLLVPDKDESPLRESLPVFQAAERGVLEEVRNYLADGGKVDIRNERGHTLLMCATHNSWPKIVRLLLDSGANPLALDAEGWNPLRHAVNGYSLDCVKLLVAAGADVGYRDSQGRSLVQLAAGEFQHRIGHFLQSPPGC